MTISPTSPPGSLPPVVDETGHLILDAQGLLKKVLLQEVFREELQQFARSGDPLGTLQRDTILLGFLYKTMVGENPADTVRDLVFNLPKVVAVMAKATHKRDATSIFLATLTDMLLRTPAEKKYAAEVGHSKRFTTLVEDNINVGQPPNQQLHLMSSLRKQVIEALVNMYEDVSSHPEGTEYLFKIFMNCKSIRELPPQYQGLFDSMTTAILPNVCHDIKDPDKVELRKNMFHNFPRRTVYTLLAMTNPFKMASSITSLFLAKPLGSRNVAQKLMETVTEINRTQKKLTEARAKVPNRYASVVHSIDVWADRIYDPLVSTYTDETLEETLSLGINPDGDVVDGQDEATTMRVKREKLIEVLNQTEGVEVPAPSHSTMSYISHYWSAPEVKATHEEVTECVRTMPDEDLAKVLAVFLGVKRLKDKHSLVDLFGDPQVIELLKSVFPMLCAPLAEIYSSAGIPHYLHDNFEWLRVIYSVGEDHKMNDAQKRKALGKGLSDFEENQFKLIHHLAKADKSNVLKSVLNWIFKKFKAGEGILLDVDPLFYNLPPTEKAEVERELARVLRFENYKNRLWKEDFDKAGKLDRPKSPLVIQHLYQPFMQLIRSQLKGVQSIGFMVMDRLD
ncbi:hypothetical protein PROFUN_13443 [Planoprotostelium fungivorum]|uniref:PX domain-containing protein n=1 Tax=Planoprotostelium fungivorum TaxID=1890364 RepID=A0A2P6N413_9EUKA|nr:hypothetical protein PROFUN_13443 [Planoprotostelium fungivorum]